MVYGNTFSKDGEITGEQSVLRYSALDLWMKNKNAYRDRYYRGKSMQTVETVFGHQVHHALEKGEMVIEGLPRYSQSEYNIEVPVTEDITIAGCLDSFEPETCSLLDYKSSHLSRDGKIPWDRVKVAKHMQLVFYSLLVRLKHGKVDPWTKLIWIETAFNKKSHEFDGHLLEAESRELSLTGKFEVFDRKIFKWELKYLTDLIKKEAVAINEDFKKHNEEK